MARDFFHSCAKTKKKSRVFCRKMEPQFLLFRCVFYGRFLLRGKSSAYVFAIFAIQ
ncbi:DUF1661 domain-containing protein [Porphyromonas gulae]|uniref:DUF1661 domain-containing protein n=1 Tax=Porphyromonas gulae TaxID=111105 RepID=UPI001E53AF9D|nr:DUF1661 domain-containing protein [Porphyromonas gulae]